MIVFHHIPKCGGASMLGALEKWYTLVRDYRAGWDDTYPKPANLEDLNDDHCLCGHWESDGFRLRQRYPGIKAPAFTFLRDPLEVRLSLRRFERAHGVLNDASIYARPNYLADRLPATWNNFREVIESYVFVGLLEMAQESLDLLADQLGNPRVFFPWLNRTEEGEILSTAEIKRFKQSNLLDYAIYEYARQRLMTSAT